MKLEIDYCRICGSYEELTFEHVPPKVSFNKVTRYKSIPYLDFLQAGNPFEPKLSAKIEQGGVGFNSLCKKCNSFLGSKYVNAFHKYSSCIGYVANRNTNNNNYFVFQLHELEPLKVLKQIISMFLSINDWEFSASHSELSDFIINPQKTTLSDRFRVFNYMNTEGQFRHLPLLVTGSLVTKETIACSEIAFPPLGHVLTIDFNGSIPFLTEITHFKNFKSHGQTRIDLEMFRLPTILPLPLDYRDKKTIQLNIKNP